MTTANPGTCSRCGCPMSAKGINLWCIKCCDEYQATATEDPKPFPDVQNPIPCGTCGADLNAPGQWLRCRRHFVATIERLQTVLKSTHDTLCAKPGSCACSERKRAEAYKAAAEAYGSFFKGPGAAFELLQAARALDPESEKETK